MLFLTVFAARSEIETINFTSPYQGSGAYAYNTECTAGVDNNPPQDGKVRSSEASWVSITSESALDSPDGSYADDTCDWLYAAHLFEFNFSTIPNNLKNITITHRTGNVLYLKNYFYVWNHTNSSWFYLGKNVNFGQASTDLQYVVYNLTFALNNYVNSSGHFAFIEVGDGTHATTDYIEIVINTNTAPSFDQTISNKSIHHNSTISIDVNCSDSEGDTITYYDNTSLFNINSSTGIISHEPSQSQRGNYSILLTCSDDTSNSTSLFSYEIKNNAPSVSSAAIAPQTPTDDSDLNCTNGSTSDSEGDTVGFYYDWYNGTHWTGFNSFQLISGNTSVGATWKCKLTANDGARNGTIAESSSVSINASIVSPVILSVSARSSSNLLPSDATYPTHKSDSLNISINWSDGNSDESWTVYVCKSTGITVSGCTEGQWCKTHSNSTVINTSCVISDVTALSYETTYSYYAYVVDNISMMSTHSTGTFRIGDNRTPNMENHSTSEAVYTESSNGIFYVDCTDEVYGSGISSAYVWLYYWDDDGATYNQNVTATYYTGNTYKATKNMNAIGDWGYRGSYCLDASGNMASNNTVNINVTVEAAEGSVPVSSGGGGSSPQVFSLVDDLPSCALEISPSYISFGNEDVEALRIKNYEDFSVTLQLTYDPDLLQISLQKNTILPDETLEIAVIKSNTFNETTLNLRFTECQPTAIKIYGEKRLIPDIKFFSGIMMFGLVINFYLAWLILAIVIFILLRFLTKGQALASNIAGSIMFSFIITITIKVISELV